MIDASRPRESSISTTGELQHSVEHSEYGDEYVGFDEGKHDVSPLFVCYLSFLYTSKMKPL